MGDTALVYGRWPLVLATTAVFGLAMLPVLVARDARLPAGRTRRSGAVGAWHVAGWLSCRTVA